MKATLPLAATALLLPLVSGCTPKPVGQLILVVQTDLALPKDIDTISIQVTTDGVPKFKNDYTRLGTSDGQIHLPGTLTLVASDNPDAAVDVIVSASSEGNVRIVREIVTTVPVGRAATMELPLQFLCNGQAQEIGGEPASSCPDGQTCLVGECKSTKVNSSTLPTFDAKKVYGDGSCLDVARCFEKAQIADVDMSGCSITAGDVNVALETEGQGICDSLGCFVALDEDPTFGWKREGQKIVLPPAVCVQLTSGLIVHVVTSPVSAACQAKNQSLPTCGPWSAAKKNAPPYVGPLALAGGQAHPTALLVSGSTVVWVAAGTAGMGDGTVKSIAVAGGTPVPIAKMTAARDVTAGDNFLLWTSAPAAANGGTITKQEGGMSITLAAGLDHPEGIATSGGQMFWTEFEGGGVFQDTVESGGTKSNIAMGNYPYRIVADTRYAYWTNEGTAGTMPPDGSVARYDFVTGGASALETLADMQTTPRAIALDLAADGHADAVYWATFAADGQLLRLTLDGTSSPEVVADHIAYPNGIALDESRVYWTDRNAGRVMSLLRTAKPLSAPTTVAEGQDSPGAIAVDDTAIYWINAGPSDVAQGAVLKLSKAP